MLDPNIKSVYELMQVFPTEQACIDYLENVRWGGLVVSPFDPTSVVYKCKGNQYRCKNTGKYFNCKSGTMFENSKISLRKFFLGIWLLTSHKKGISSLQLARDLGITQKSAWFLAHRIRACFGIENEGELEGCVSSDESFFGGKNRNRHKNKKVPHSQGRSFKDKIPVLGILQRNGKLRAIAIPDTKAKTIQPVIKSIVKFGSTLISDEWLGYKGLGKHYQHYVIDHSKKQYVDYNNPEIHTNDIEGFWGIIKRGYNGIYNWWSKKHINKYVSEFVFRYNLRSLSDRENFIHLLQNCNVRTTYKELIQLKC
ncbi:IS1595 family transposase [Chryseobacterium sp.]|uniref:IS1595 family transposase n=1 Tax=Chryseobacterium sp. TaxID=1871047 RepID=UPI003340C523